MGKGGGRDRFKGENQEFCFAFDKYLKNLFDIQVEKSGWIDSGTLG